MGEERIYILKLVIVWCVRKIFVPFNRLDRKLGVYMEVIKVAQDAKSRKSAHANAKRALMETYLKRRKERRWTIKRTGETREKKEEGRGKIKGERYREKTKGDNNERLREKGGRKAVDWQGRTMETEQMRGNAWRRWQERLSLLLSCEWIFYHWTIFFTFNIL